MRDPATLDLESEYQANQSRLREFADGGSEVLWSLTTPPGGYVYRATASTRLPGEALAGAD